MVQDSAANILQPEDFTAVAYYKPLDGRQFEGFDMPLINYQPLTEAAFNALNTGLTYSDYPNGVTSITTITNDGTGTLLPNVFSQSDVGKRFVGLKKQPKSE